MIMNQDITRTNCALETPPRGSGNYAASQQDDLQHGENTLCKEGHRIRSHGGMVVLLKRLQLEKILQLSRSGIYRLMDKNSSAYSPDFPLPIRYGNGKAVYWIAEEVAEWLEAQISLSRKVNKTSPKATNSQPAGRVC
jgi:predicted DNA-binding transcriptional regulator AlpA